VFRSDPLTLRQVGRSARDLQDAIVAVGGEPKRLTAWASSRVAFGGTGQKRRTCRPLIRALRSRAREALA